MRVFLPGTTTINTDPTYYGFNIPIVENTVSYYKAVVIFNLERAAQNGLIDVELAPLG